MKKDITHCTGDKCPIKDKCHRYDIYKSKRKINAEGMSFTNPPFEINKGKFECKMFLGDHANHLLMELKSIMSGKNLKKKIII